MRKILTGMMLSVATVLPLIACSDHGEHSQNNHHVEEDEIGENEAPNKQESESELKEENKSEDSSVAFSKRKEYQDASDQAKSETSNSLSEYTCEELNMLVFGCNLAKIRISMN